MIKFNIEKSVNNENTVELTGELDAAAIETYREMFSQLADSQSSVTLNFSGVSFIDSSGIGAIVFLFKRLRTMEKPLHIVDCQGQPLKLFKHLRIDRSIDINGSLS